MANNISETITENNFREYYGSKTFIEKSAIPNKYGFKSKKGTDYKGYPDFFKEGFLMSAMAELIKLCDNNPTKIQHVKDKQLIGFEIDPILFSLACH